jgi:DNA-binding SARP family transcriptional activator
LDREVVTALAQLAELCSPEEAVLHLERATTIDPTAEHLYLERMEAYANLGRTSEIHASFQELADALAMLEMTPSKRARQEYQRLTQP